MGGSESTLPQIAGFRIVNLYNKSPAHLAGLELFFDSILEIDGLSFVSPSRVPPTEFSKQVIAAENRTVKLVVFNSRTRAFRDVWITPRKWTDEPLGLLGASVRFIDNVTEYPNGLRILSVFENSPASRTGLIPGDDYLMGTIDTDFETLDDLLDVVSISRAEPDQPLQLSVYNAKQENVRRVLLQSDENWGGEGSLGCDVGQGLLHRLPPPRTIHSNSYTRYVYSGRKDSTDDESSASEDRGGMVEMNPAVHQNMVDYDDHDGDDHQSQRQQYPYDNNGLMMSQNGGMQPEQQQFLGQGRSSELSTQTVNGNQLMGSFVDDRDNNRHKATEMATTNSGVATTPSEQSVGESTKVDQQQQDVSQNSSVTVSSLPQHPNYASDHIHHPSLPYTQFPNDQRHNTTPPIRTSTSPSHPPYPSFYSSSPYQQHSPPRPGILYQSK